MPPTDRERLDQLLRARHRCIWIVTQEEQEALRLVRDAAMSARMDMRLWSAVKGLCNGLVENTGAEANTENAAAALYALAQSDPSCLAVTLDLAPFLKDD